MKTLYSLCYGCTVIAVWLGMATAAAQEPQLFMDINPGSEPSYGNDFTEYDGKAYFRADDGVHGMELWVTDGTEAGTHMIKDINPDPYGIPPGYFTVYDGKFYFFAEDVNGRNLWVTDGTEAGTVMVKNFDPASTDVSPYPSKLKVFNGLLIFDAHHTDYGREIWRSDGTEAGTFVIEDINPGPESGRDSAYAGDHTAYDGKLYFRADDGVHGWEVWVTDGTEAGTYMLKDINSGSGDGASSNIFKEYNGKLYFQGNDGVHGRELWVTDGTEAGTQMVVDIGSGMEEYGPSHFKVYNGKLYFKAYDFKIWHTDGTVAGTGPLLVEDLSNPQAFYVYDGKLYFSAYSQAHGRTLWATDGTVEGTVPFPSTYYPLNFIEYNGRLYFICNNKALWVTDGTQAGTYLIEPSDADFPNIPGPNHYVANLRVWDDTLNFMACYHQQYGCEPYYYKDGEVSVNGVATNDLSYWPNPFSGELHIEAANPISHVKLFTMTGQKIASHAINASRETLALSHLPAGVYFMEVTTRDDSVIVRVVKR